MLISRVLQAFACGLILTLLGTGAWSQETKPANPSSAAPSQSSSTPTAADPDQYMRQANDAMSLTASGMKPWHLSARYKKLKPTGEVDEEGLFEVWFSSPGHSKTAFTSAGLTRTEYRSGNQVSFTGKEEGPTQTQEDVSHYLLHPLSMFYAYGMEKIIFTAKDLTLGQSELKCLTGASKDPKETLIPTSTNCFDKALPIPRLRIDTWGDRITWNGVARVHGHFVAKQIRLASSKQDPWLTIDVEKLDDQLTTDESEIAPPADAKSAAFRFRDVATEVRQGQKISGELPYFPATARSVRASGSAILQATIGKDGKVKDVKVLSGLQVLQPTAISAIKTWVYQPFLLDERPVEVTTTVIVNFRL